MKIKRILALVLVFALVVALSACAGKSVPAGLNDDGRFIYTITRTGDPNAAPEIQDGARIIRTAIKDNFDVKVTMAKDDAIEDYDNNYEILIGNTNREESTIAYDKLVNNRSNNSKDFIVAVINDKICIQAITDVVLLNACEWFAQTFCQSLDTWATLNSKYEFLYECPATTISNTVNGVELGTYNVIIPRYSVYLWGIIAEDIVTLHNKSNYPMSLSHDTAEETKNEILVGDTNREESKSVNVEGDNYIIKVVGDKLVVKGGNDTATRAGLEHLYNEIKKSVDTGVMFNWSDGHTINGKYDPAAKGAYTLNWNDEFEGTTTDLNKWGDYRNEVTATAGASCLGGNVYWQNVHNESLYKGSNLQDLIYQSDGNLHMITQKVTDKDFVGAQISSYWTMIYRYGIMEIRANLADVPAAVSLWVNGSTTSGDDFTKRFGGQNRTCMTEIDILENYGSDSSYGSAIHRWWSQHDKSGGATGSGHNGIGGIAMYTGKSKNNHTLKYSEVYGGDLTKDYHVFSFYWDDTCYKFAFDGKKYFDYQFEDNNSVSVHCLMNYFIMRCRMGLATYGATYKPEEHPLTSELLVDYVRIYQSEDMGAQLITSWPEKQENGETKITYPNNAVGGMF